MGVINLTPDSFYPSSRYQLDAAVEKAKQMLAEGASIIDFGAESTRPGAKIVASEVQSARLVPVIASLRKDYDGDISIDTSDPKVMLACIAAGANMINDVRSLKQTGAIDIIASNNVKVCLTHMLGEPETMQLAPEYPQGLIKTINDWCDSTYERCLKANIAAENIILDPGFGFGKSLMSNWELLNSLEVFTAKYQIAIGVSNKSMFKTISNCHDVNQRRIPSCICEAFATFKQVSIIRTHDIITSKQAIETAHLIIGANQCSAQMV